MTNRLYRVAAFVMVFSYADYGLQFLGQMVMGRLLTVEDFGIYTALNSIALVFTLFSVSYPLLVLKNVSRVSVHSPGRSRACVRAAVSILCKAMVPVAVIAYLASPWLREFYHLEVLFPLFIVITAFAFSPFVSSLGAVLQALQLYVHNAVIAFSITILRISLGSLFVAYLGFRYWGLFSGLIAASVFALCVTVYLLHKHLPAEASTEKFKFDFDGWPSAIFISIGMATLIGLDTSLARHFLDPVEAGLYSAASLTAKIVLMVSGPFASMIVPEATRAQARATSALALPKLIMISLSVAALTWLALSLLPEFVLTVLVGKKFLAAAPLVPVCAATGLFITAVSLMNQYCFALGVKNYFYVVYASAVIGISIVALFFHSSAMQLATGILSVTLISSALGLAAIWLSRNNRQHVPQTL